MTDGVAIQKALNAWFESQSIPPTDAVEAMLTVVGASIGRASDGPDELATRLAQANHQITLAALVTYEREG